MGNFLDTWQGTRLENRITRIVLVLLAVAILVLALVMTQMDRTVVLVPPTLEGEVTIARERASQEVKEAWALFVAQLLGNVSPTGAEFLSKALDPLLAPTLRRDVLRVLETQVREIQRENVSLSFQPRAISYDPATDTVFITGAHTTSGPAAQPVQAERTFEVCVAFANYRPTITHLSVYAGQPRIETPDAPATPESPRSTQ